MGQRDRGHQWINGCILPFNGFSGRFVALDVTFSSLMASTVLTIGQALPKQISRNQR